MQDRELIAHVEDTQNNINLKIYENEIPSTKSIFDFEIQKENSGYYHFSVDEEVAAIMFEGLCQIFENDDSEYQTDNKAENYNRDILGDFFNYLKYYDNKHFNEE